MTDSTLSGPLDPAELDLWLELASESPPEPPRCSCGDPGDCNDC